MTLFITLSGRIFRPLCFNEVLNLLTFLRLHQCRCLCLQCFCFLEERFPRRDNKIPFRYDSCRYLNP